MAWQSWLRGNLAARRWAAEALVSEASTEVLAARAVCSGLQGQMWSALAACLAVCMMQQLLLKEAWRAKRANDKRKADTKTDH